MYLGLDRQGDALDCLHRALVIHRATGDRPNQALTLKFLGQAQLSAGQVDNGRESLARALAIFAELGDDSRAAQIQSELASLTP